MGKFSKPRNRFQESQTPDTMPPLTPQVRREPASEVHYPVEPNYPEDPLRQEDEAIEQTFLEVTGGSPRESALAEFFSRNKKVILISVCACVLVFLVILVAALAIGGSADPYDGKILNNVTIAGINVGGLTKSQAENVLRSATDHTFTQQDMVVELPGGKQLRLSPKDTGAKLDVKAAVKAAYQYGRTGSQAQKKAAYESSLTKNHIIALLPYLELDTDFILQAVQSLSAEYESPYREASWQLEGDMPELSIPAEGENPGQPQNLLITLGTPGVNMDTESLYEAILDAYSFNLFLVVHDSEELSQIPASPDLQAIYDACYIAPVDASMDQQTYEAIPGTYGYDFDLELARELVNAAEYGDTVSVPMRFIEPGVEEDSLLFQDILGYCETPHTQNENRNHNLTLVCQILDGLILDPGEEFSYNDSVGERTAARGFKGAPAYSGTKLVDSIGGGVCQGSSTLYYASLLADMEIVYRINHGFPVSYIPYGLDATVNWGGPDFKFRNTSNYPIQLKAEVSGGYVKMWIMGTEERDYYVKLDYEITRYISPNEVYEEYGPDSGYYDGQILQHGTPGYTVRSYKYKYSKATDELISKDFIALSSYMTEDKIIVKIVGGDDEEESTEPSETTEPSTDPSQPSSETTQPSTEATQPSSESTQPSSEEATQPSSEAAIQPSTEAPTQPPTEATTQPTTQPPADPE